MKKAWVLAKIYINSLYGISRLISDVKSNRKNALKVLGFLAIILVAVSGTATTFVALNIEMYKALAPFGQQGVIINSSIIIATVFTLIFGFIGIIATYYIDKEADIVLSMPFEPWHILFAKVSTNYVMEFLITAFLMGTGVIVYGVKSGAGVLFYIMYLIIALLIPVIPLVISYLIIIPAMKVGSIFKKKDVTMIVTSFLAMIAILVLQNVMTKTMMSLQKDPKLINEFFTKQDGLVSLIGRVYPPSAWGTFAITDVASTRGIMGLLLLIITGAIALLLLHLLMSKLYIQSVIGSGEVRKVARRYSDKELKGNLRGKSKLSSMVIREIKLMNREPVFFLNGPFIIILLPVLFGIMFAVQGGEVFKMVGKISEIPNSTYYGTLGIAGFGALLGGMASITPSAISREGKAFMFLKSLPIDPMQYINAKLIHGLIFGVLGGLISCAVGTILPGMKVQNFLLAFIISQLVIMPALLAGMIMELAWPKLIWDNAQKAIKQNLNVMISIFGEMIILYALVALVITVLKEPLTGYLALTIVPVVMSVVLYNFLKRYLQKRFYEIEI